MFCPNCGSNIKSEQVFCRECGVDVVDFSQALVEQMKNAESGERNLWLKRTGSFLFAALVIMSFVFAAALGLGNRVTFIYFAFTILGLLGGATGLLIFENQHSKHLIEDEKRKRWKNLRIAQHQTVEISEAQNKQNLLSEPTFRSFSSVTENTTEFFTAEMVKRKTSGELG